jgi:hypothetical protein
MLFASKSFTGKTLSTTRFDGCIKYVAVHTFALYLFHMPLMYLMQAIFPFSEKPIWAFMSILVFTPLIIWGVSAFIERTKHVYADLFYRLFEKYKSA